MMTHGHLLDILRPVGILWTYHHWEQTPQPPYGVYLDTEDTAFYADNRTYFCSSGVQLELYTLQRDRALDDRVRTVLDAADIPYEVQFAWIESEGLYETIFEIEV